MKNKKRHNSSSDLPLAVTACIDELMFLEELVKHLADARSVKKKNIVNLEEGWEAIDSSSLEIYVTGNMIISHDNTPLRTPYTTSFLFTCIKENQGGYVLAGCFSLS